MKARKINLTITGCLGRMGQQLIKSANKDKKFKIISLTENKAQRKKILGILPRMNNPEAFEKADIIIDFTVPKCTLEVLKIALKQKKKSGDRNYRLHPKRGRRDQKNLKKDSNSQGRKYEPWNKCVDVFN